MGLHRNCRCLFHLKNISYFFFIFIFLFLQGKSSALNINGYLDFTYSNLDSKTDDKSGTNTDTKSTNFRQQYYLTVSQNFYPNLRLLANGLFDRSATNTDTDGNTTKSTTTILRPNIELRLSTPLYTAGLVYNRREEKDEVTGSSNITNINEEYDGIFGWRPDGFPKLDLRLSRINNFDKERSFKDTTDDLIQLSYIYDVFKGLLLKYQLNYDDFDDKLNSLETKSIKNSGKIIYDTSFFHDRVTLYTSYDVNRRTMDITASKTGKGEVSLPVTIFSGLTGISDTPTLVILNSINPPAPELIDGNTASITESQDVNIGFVGNDRQRNIGSDFSSPAEVNSILLYVNRELPRGIFQYFLSGVAISAYTSSDNEHWILVPNSPTLQFDATQNRFEIDFPNIIKTRYIKVVITPLPQSVAISVPTFTDPDKIFITEIQAFIKKPASEANGKTSTTNQVYNINSRVRILDKPFLFYDFSYYLNKTSGDSSTKRSTLLNGFSLTHRFNEIFSTDARVAREDDVEDRGDTTAYIYNASLNAVPLKTLSNSLNFSKRTEKNPDGKSDKNNIFLYNTAELYKGVNTYLNLGYSASKLETKRNQKSTNVNFGANIVPNNALTININYFSTDTNESGAGKKKTNSTSKRSEFTASYRPVRTLYLVASISKSTQDKRKDTLQNYSINWSPFPDGDLQLRFEYNQNLRSQDNGVDKQIRPSLRWNINKRTFLDISYLIFKSKTNDIKTDSKLFNVEFRINF